MAGSASRTSSTSLKRMSIGVRPASGWLIVTRTKRLAKFCGDTGTPLAPSPLKSQCTTGPERRITRWEHEQLLEEVQQRLDENPQAMRQRRETVEQPFGTMKARMGATHFLTKTLPKVAAEMALSVLAYNLTRVMNIIGVKPLMAASDACDAPGVLAADPQRRSGWPARGPVTCIQIAKNARNA
ncbi:MAG: hypothetical protein EHM67_11455, partial [Hyphomicrobiaceae bacterium]